jgi:hypothetical protein
LHQPRAPRRSSNLASFTPKSLDCTIAAAVASNGASPTANAAPKQGDPTAYITPLSKK